MIDNDRYFTVIKVDNEKPGVGLCYTRKNFVWKLEDLHENLELEILVYELRHI